jgi:hypothetical protein
MEKVYPHPNNFTTPINPAQKKLYVQLQKFSLATTFIVSCILYLIPWKSNKKWKIDETAKMINYILTKVTSRGSNENHEDQLYF